VTHGQVGNNAQLCELVVFANVAPSDCDIRQHTHLSVNDKCISIVCFNI